MKIFFVDGDTYFEYEGERYYLRDEEGWWTDDSRIYVYSGLSLLRKVGVVVHEVVEYVVERKLRVRHREAHFIANLFEFTIGLGFLYWLLLYLKKKERRREV